MGQVVPAFKSGDITSMAGVDGYIEIPVDVSTIEAGGEGRDRHSLLATAETTGHRIPGERNPMPRCDGCP